MKLNTGAGIALLMVAGIAIVPRHTAHADALSHRFNRVCGLPNAGGARCTAAVWAGDAASPRASASPVTNALTPAQLHTAYNLPCTPKGVVQSVCAAPSTFGGQTIGIIVAYHDPTIQNDLGIYSQQYGLPACTAANGCLAVVGQSGGTALPASVDGNWAVEESMDVEVSHAVCQTCKIVVVEANSNGWNDLSTAVNTAAALGATEISNSYGAPEWSNETFYDSAYNHPGVAVVAASGDGGYGTEYPASSPYVVAVGGTTLSLGTNNGYGSESVWSGSGSGCSLYEPANSWQVSLSTWAKTGCGNQHGASDVAAVADPATGASIYDSTPYNSSTGWWQLGGTSLATPIIAGIFALAGGVPAGTNAQSIPYATYGATNSHDVTTGSNGSCGTIMCAGAVSYDGPTGLGSPNGTAGYGGPVIVLATATPISTPSPTSTPRATPTATKVATATPTSTPTCKGRCNKP